MSEESKGGRPSKYKPEYAEQLIKYFEIEPYREVNKEVVTKSGDVVTISEDQANDFPSLAGFAIQIGVHRDTLHEWSTQHPEFSDAYKRAKDYQENFLVINGNRGLIPAAFGIFTAKNILKWRDKQPDEIDTVVNNNVNSFSEDDLDQRIKEKLKKIGAGE